MSEYHVVGEAMSIGENLKTLRERRGLTQPAIAALIDTPKTTYIGWEHDKNPPPADKVADLARVLGCSTDELIFEKAERSVSEDMRALFRRLATLPDDMQSQARTIIRGLVLSLEEEAAKRDNDAA